GRSCFCAGAAGIENRKSKIENEKGHSARRRGGDTALSVYQGRLETACPDLPQTNDLSSATVAESRRSAGGAGHFPAKRFTDAPGLSRQWHTARNSDRLRRTSEAGRNRPGISDRREIYRRLRRVADFRRQHFLRKTRLLSRRARHRAWRMHFRVSSSRP